MVTEPDLLEEEELMMGSRDSHLDDNIVICNGDKMSVIKSLCLSLVTCVRQIRSFVCFIGNWSLTLQRSGLQIARHTYTHDSGLRNNMICIYLAFEYRNRL